MEKPLFSVSQFVATVNQTLEYGFGSVLVEGEVSSFKINQSKYVFFDLKDESTSVSCFMMVWQLRMPIEDGMKVVVRANPKLTNWGKFSLTVQSITPKGEGNLKKSFEILKARLDKEGLFAEERKRLLPQMPSSIGVVSSVQSAGYADFIKILQDRWGGVEVEVAHVQVQGEVAPDQIISAINYFNQRDKMPQVLVIIRGGGSVDDLAVFNDEMLVRAIASSRTPTLTGIGHETDQTLADLAADFSASTPSNAAQVVVPDKKHVIESINNDLLRALEKIESRITQAEMEVYSLRREPLLKIEQKIQTTQMNVESFKNLLKSFDPKSVLERGYAIVRGKTKVGGVLTIETKSKIIKAEVKNVANK